MLAIKRREQETIRIGHDITVTIVRLSGSTVTIGVQAPQEVTVHRGEVYDRIQAEEGR